jgi:thiol-disulfide isomerase/thioredoxin
LQGQVVVLDFWATWCAPCRAQTPVLERVARTFGGQLRVLGVGTSDDLSNVTRFLKRSAPSYPSVFDDQEVASSQYGVRGLPTIVVIAKDGTVRAVSNGFTDENELARLVKDALK